MVFKPLAVPGKGFFSLISTDNSNFVSVKRLERMRLFNLRSFNLLVLALKSISLCQTIVLSSLSSFH